MQHLILFAYILIFSTGFAAIVSLVVLRMRVRSKLITPMIVLQSLFMANLAIVAVYFYLSNMMGLVGAGSGTLDTAFGITAGIFNAAIFVSMIRNLHLIGKRDARRMSIDYPVTRITAGLTIVALLLRLFLRSDSPIVPYLSPATFVLATAATGVFGVVLTYASLGTEHSAVQRMIRWIGICAMGFIPLSIIEYLLGHWGIQPYHPLSLEFLFYLGVNGVMIKAGLDSLILAMAETPAFDLVDHKDLAARFALTPREWEMVPLIAKGMTNREIAFELHISPATVRTHIYNLYQKVGVQSRIELLNTLSS